MKPLTRSGLSCGCALVSVAVEHQPGCMCGKPQHPANVERIWCGEHERKNGEAEAAADADLGD